jgi:hypothetical protein
MDLALGSAIRELPVARRLAVALGATAIICSVASPVSALAQTCPGGGNVQVSPASDLSFGTLVQGYSLTVAPGEEGSALYIVALPQGAPPNRTVRLDFDLDQPVVNAEGVQLPVAYGPASAAWGTSDVPSSGTRFQPTPGGHEVVLQQGQRTLWVWLGGKAGDAPSPGSFRGTVTLAVECIR